MELRPFTIAAKCVADDAELYGNIASACLRGLPVVPQDEPHDGIAVMVGSGPSLNQFHGSTFDRPGPRTLVAIKDAHDWLIERGVVPDYAVAIDPQASRAHVFQSPHQRVKYLLASQCHPETFDWLKDYDVRLWHCYVRQGQQMPPPGTPLIGGGTTSGLRAIVLFYSLGFRQFELYGYDSCLADGRLRMNGDRPRQGDDTINEIVVNGKTFHCNPSMTAQATEFQSIFSIMPDIEITIHGGGLLAEIMTARAAQPQRTISFIHGGGPQAASYRYRALLPARELAGSSINDFDADVLIFSKPEPSLIPRIKMALGMGQGVIADFCDDHFDRQEYKDILRLADVVTCGTETLATLIRSLGRQVTVIPEPYELPEAAPHCNGNRCLWFGHASNFLSLLPLLPDLAEFPLRVMTNRGGVHNYTGELLEWSPEALQAELAQADIVLMPTTAAYKSPNRTIEAIRAGCFVVAEPHPSIMSIPGIWIGNIREGIIWAQQHRTEANARTAQAQEYIRLRHAPRTVAAAWSRTIQACPSTWAAEPVTGRGGSTLTMNTPEPMCIATS
jgi:uncharacterized Rossmann fold enzyme